MPPRAVHIRGLRRTNGGGPSGPAAAGPAAARRGAGPPLPRVTARGRPVRLVVLEANEGQGPDIDPARCAIRLTHRQAQIKPARGRRLEAEAVLLAIAGDIPGEDVETVRPPEARPFVRVERQCLPRQ